MSNCVRASPSRPSLPALNSLQSQQKRHLSCILPHVVNKTLSRSLKFTAQTPKKGQYEPLLKHTQAGPSVYQKNPTVCLLGGKDKSEGGKEGFPWSLDKVMDNFKGKSVEDVLRQQIEKEEYYDGGSGNNPPRGGGGGGGGGMGGGFGGSEDEGLPGMLDETLQVTLATIGIIFVYAYVINGEEMLLLVRDYLKYVLRGNQSFRLKKVMDKWNYIKKLTEPQWEDPFWLEKEIINTPTLYDSPDKYWKLRRTLKASKSEEE